MRRPFPGPCRVDRLGSAIPRRASHRQLRAAQCSLCTAIGTRALLRYAPIDDPRERSATEGCAEVLDDRVAALDLIGTIEARSVAAAAEGTPPSNA